MQSCFISYQREDKPIADRVYQRLKQHGIDVWMDKPPAPFRHAGIPAGQLWDDQILHELNRCYAFLPIFTNREVEADSYFTKELQLAASLNANGQAAEVILPILSNIDNVPPLPLNLSFSAFQWVDLLEDGLSAVVAALKPMLDRNDPVHDEITVTSLGQFIAAIGSNRSILLDNDDLDLTLNEPIPSGLSFVSSEDVFDGRQLTIHDVENLEIRPANARTAHVFVSPRYAFPLDFFQCQNIRISGLSMGHHPETGSCVGGVFRAKEVRGLSVTHCDLYGCGTEGFQLRDCHQVIIDSCVVRDCTDALSSLYGCNGVSIRQSMFRNNAAGPLSFEDCSNVEVLETGFEHSKPTAYSFGSQALIFAAKSQDIRFRDCWASQNAHRTLEANAGSVEFINCRWDNL